MNKDFGLNPISSIFVENDIDEVAEQRRKALYGDDEDCIENDPYYKGD